MTVLVVEDQSNLAEPLQDLLEGRGHGCLTACDVEEAEWTVRTVHVDVLVLDLDLPGRSSREWLAELALASPGLARSTVAITGRPAEVEDGHTIRSLGASLLRKPFAIQALHDAVQEKLRKVVDSPTPVRLPDDEVPPLPIVLGTRPGEPEEH
jgi:DNA-binding response OmpR family regulator